MNHLTEDTRALLRAAREIHAERHGIQTFTLGTHLPLEEAGRRTGLNPNRLRYYDAIKELEYEGAIEWDESARYARGDKRYVITERGLKMLGNPTRSPVPRSLDLSPDEVSPVTGLATRERTSMSQPIRVEGWAYTPGAQVSLRLRFRSQSSYARVKAEFHNPSGGVIKLEGVSHPGEESGAAHTEVVLKGHVPESAALGTYECRSVEGLTGERKWAPIFEDPAFNIRVVQRPFHAQRGGEFLGLEPA